MKIFGLFSFLECVDNVLRRLGKDISDSELMTLNKLNRHQLGKHNRQRETSAYDYLVNIWNDQKHPVNLRKLQYFTFVHDICIHVSNLIFYICVTIFFLFFLFLTCQGSFVNEVLVNPLNKPGLLENLERYIAEFYADSGKPQSSGQSTKKSTKRKNRHTVLANRLKQNFSNKTEAGPSPAMGQHQDQLQEILKRLDKIEKNTKRQELNQCEKFMKGSPLDNIGQYCPPSFLNSKFNSFNMDERKVF